MNAIAKEWDTFPPLPRLPSLREHMKSYIFQDWTINKSMPNPVFGYGVATGLGKTFMSLDRFLRYREEHPGTKAVVLTNKSATVQFAAEYVNFYDAPLAIMAIHDQMPKLGQKVYAKTRLEAYSRFAQPGGADAIDMVVMNYSLFRNDAIPLIEAVATVVGRGQKVVFIPDEASNFSNLTTHTHKAVHEMGQTIRPFQGGGLTLFLTATMLNGRLEQMYCIFAAVGLDRAIAESWEAFLEEFCVVGGSRRAIVPRPALEQTYYFITNNRLDDGLILGLQAFKRLFNITYRDGKGWISKHDLDRIRAMCSRNLDFQRMAPDLATFYARLGVTFEEKEVKEEPTILGYKNLDVFQRRAAPYVVMLAKTDVAQHLPPFVPRHIRLDHSTEQRNLIRDIYRTEIKLDDYVLGDMVGDAEAMQDVRLGTLPVQRLTEQGYIRRALCDPRLVHKQRLDDFSAKTWSPKTAELIRFLSDEATGERVIVYSPSKVYQNILVSSIKAATGIEPWYTDPLLINGDVGALDREARRVLFQTSPAHRLIILNDAGIEAMNLQAASVLWLMGFPPNGGKMIQLAGRPSRLGSVHSSILLVYCMIADSQDEDDYDVIHKQMQLISLVQGEAERGLLDHARLREMAGVDETVSAEDWTRWSTSRLMLNRRPRRAKAYGAALPD